MVDHVDGLGHAPRLVGVVAREEPSHALVEVGVGHVHQHQPEQEVRDREAAEADEREDVVSNRVLADRRVYTDGDGERPGHHYRKAGQHHRRPDPVADYHPHGALLGLASAPHLERQPQVALSEIPDPHAVADEHGPVEAEVLPQHFGLLRVYLGCGEAARHDLVHVPLDRVAGRQLADEEREQRNRPDSEDAENDSPRNIGQHWRHLVGSRRPLCQMRIWTPTHLHGRSGTSGRRYGRPLPRQGPHSGHGPTCHALCGKVGGGLSKRWVFPTCAGHPDRHSRGGGNPSPLSRCSGTGPEHQKAGET